MKIPPSDKGWTIRTEIPSDADLERRHKEIMDAQQETSGGVRIFVQNGKRVYREPLKFRRMES